MNNANWIALLVALIGALSTVLIAYLTARAKSGESLEVITDGRLKKLLDLQLGRIKELEDHITKQDAIMARKDVQLTRARKAYAEATGKIEWFDDVT